MRAGAFKGGRDVTADEFLDALAQAVMETLQNYWRRQSQTDSSPETPLSLPLAQSDLNSSDSQNYGLDSASANPQAC